MILDINAIAEMGQTLSVSIRNAKGVHFDFVGKTFAESPNATAKLAPISGIHLNILAALIDVGTLADGWYRIYAHDSRPNLNNANVSHAAFQIVNGTVDHPICL